jgi:hypothetical protein
MKRRGRTEFDESAMLNNRTYWQYVERLTELAISRFIWHGLPDTVDERYMELHLFRDGQMVWFEDEAIGELCLNLISSGRFDVYGYPVIRRAYSFYNNYQKMLKPDNSVVIYNNLLRTNSLLDVKMFALRLYNMDRIIDVNVNAQKTPVLIVCDEKERLTMKNVYMQYDGNQPVIFGDNNLNAKGMTVLKTDAPFVADKIYQLKCDIWNEALTYLGITNVTVNKKERLITDEVERNQGGVVANRYPYLNARNEGGKKVQKMFGHECYCEFREDWSDFHLSLGKSSSDSEGGDDNE